MKKTLLIFVLIILAGVAFYFLKNKSVEGPEGTSELVLKDHRNISYMIEGESVLLANGKAETEIPDSESSVSIEYFGNEMKADMNGDGVEDIAFILTQNGGGTGIFYYVVAALGGKNGGYVGTNAVLLGDRIAPQTTEFRNGELIVNYADRKPDEPMTADPSVGVSKYLRVTGENLEEVTK